MVLADTGTLATLPPRELRAAVRNRALIGDAAFFAWCEANGAAVVSGDREAQAEAIALGDEISARRNPTTAVRCFHHLRSRVGSRVPLR